MYVGTGLASGTQMTRPPVPLTTVNGDEDDQLRNEPPVPAFAEAAADSRTYLPDPTPIDDVALEIGLRVLVVDVADIQSVLLLILVS
jgi:hypothetical protein